MIFFCLSAKLRLSQDYRALFENFFASHSKKACFFQVERLPKTFYDAAKAGKKPLRRPTEHQKLTTVANMVAKSGIDALKY